MEFSVNHPILFILAGLIIAAVLGQSVYFLAKALKRSKEIGMDARKIRKTIKTAALNSGTVGIMVPVSVLFTIAVARILYKRGVL